MALTGKQKAAMLLMSLDAATAAKMVKGLDSNMVQDLAVELAYLDATGYRNNEQNAEVALQFCSSLTADHEFHIDNFLNELLKSTVGEGKAEQIQIQIQDLLQKRDPFITIRSADAQTIASVLGSEHPQVVAVVLSELPAKKSSEVLGLLSDGVRLSAVGRMAGSDTVTSEAKTRIAQTVCQRLQSLTSSKAGEPSAVQPEQPLRKVAVILRNLGTELRDGLLDAIKKKDNEAGEKVVNLMIIWSDILQIADRSLQEGLRGVDSRKMALALHKADDAVIKKIRYNISERAAAALDEEASLMSAPKKDDIEAAREEIVQVLRQMNEKGELAFIEE